MLTSVNMYVLSIGNLTVALTWAIRRVGLCAFLVSLVMGFESNHLTLMVHLNEYVTDPVNTQHLDGLMPGPCSHFYFDINFGNRLHIFKREEAHALLFSFEYNLLPNLITK